MSGPVDIVESRENSTRYESQAKSSTHINVSFQVQPQSTSALRHPGIVVNARRSDGTRAMSAWSKEWYRYAERPQNWDAMWNDTGSGWRWSARNDLLARYAVPPASARNPWSDIRTLIPWTPSLELSSDAVARTKVLNKVGQKKWDLGVTAYELKQTAGLVTDLATSFAHAVDKVFHSSRLARKQTDRFLKRVVKHGDFYKAAAEVGIKDINLLNDIRSKWMQYQFGIRPAIRDVDDAVTALSDMLNKSGYAVLVKAKAGHTSKDEYQSAHVCGSYSAVYRAHLSYAESCTTHYSVVYEIPTGHVPDITTLGLDNPWAFGWEVTRLSWMFDYVIGVGDWLSSFTAANGMIFREGSRSILKRAVSNNIHVIDTLPASSHWTKGITNRVPYVERGEFRRTLVPSHGVTPAVVPQIRTELGLVQLANSLFALSSVLGGKPGLR